jgi:hypothetical protein
VSTDFSETLSKWVRETTERVEAVYARSFELLGEELAKTKPEGGNVPFMTGNLARSLLASKSGMPDTSDGPYSGQDFGLVSATLKADETVYIGYQAVYARRRNYGYVGADSLGRVYNEAGDHFVETAAAEWKSIVIKATAEVKGLAL